MTGRLIGVGGYAGTGKDAVATILEDSHGFYGTFMSQPLNAALCRLNPQVEVRRGEVFRYVDLINQLGYTKAKELPEVRRLLQAMGTEVGRDMFGQNVWIGGGAIICPGVTIGSRTVIGAGSVVTRDIPEGVLAAGNPCRVIRELAG